MLFSLNSVLSFMLKSDIEAAHLDLTAPTCILLYVVGSAEEGLVTIIFQNA
jgi:hypothetical protein